MVAALILFGLFLYILVTKGIGSFLWPYAYILFFSLILLILWGYLMVSGLFERYESTQRKSA